MRAVNERELPAADDAFAETTGFAHASPSCEADVRTRLERMKQLEQGVEARDKVLEALLATVEVPLPESVVEAELEWRKQSTTQQLAAAPA